MPAGLTVTRVLASSIDAATYLVPAAVVLPFGVLALRGGFTPDPVVANLIGFVSVILPATVWTAGWEALRGGTPGKRLLGLRVRDRAGGAPRPRQAAVRALIKITVPWTLGHLTAYAFVNGEPVGSALVAMVAATYLVPLVMVVMLVLPGHRPPHDRIAATVVQPVGPRSSDHPGPASVPSRPRPGSRRSGGRRR